MTACLGVISFGSCAVAGTIAAVLFHAMGRPTSAVSLWCLTALVLGGTFEALGYSDVLWFFSAGFLMSMILVSLLLERSPTIKIKKTQRHIVIMAAAAALWTAVLFVLKTSDTWVSTCNAFDREAVKLIGARSFLSGTELWWSMLILMVAVSSTASAVLQIRKREKQG